VSALQAHRGTEGVGWLGSDAQTGAFGQLEYLTVPLAPVSDLQVRSLLTVADDLGVAELLTRIAAASDRVQDAALVSGELA
jgi:hypothetical protein